MQKSNQPIVNFNKGFITEANPLAQPVGSTTEEQNFTLGQDGVRRRRFGMDYENGAIHKSHSIQTEFANMGTNTFRWDLTGLESSLYLIVVQLGTSLYFFESTDSALSGSYVGYAYIGGWKVQDKSYSLTQVNNLLVVATGKNIYTVERQSTYPTFKVEEVILEVRDFFGLEDKDPVTDKHIDRGNDLNFRPPRNLDPAKYNSTGNHLYNLFNQGWPTEPAWCYSDGLPKQNQVSPFAYTLEVLHLLPSNADIYTNHVVANTGFDPKDVKAFLPHTMQSGEISTFEAPKGRFILKLLDRGYNRQAVYPTEELIDFQPPVPTLVDRTPDSASTVASFAGRVFYAGFSGEVEGGDDKSPTLNNFVAFSQLVQYKQQASQCYQVADPTSGVDSEIVDTDGGLIQITGASKIVGLVAVSNSLLVVAENGIWQVLGGSGYGFSATNYQVVKVSDRGCIAPRSIVEVNESVYYWASDGIYLLSSSESGFYVGQDLTRATIKTFYSALDRRQEAFGNYDDYDKAIKWLVNGQELIYRVDFQAWTRNVIAKDDVSLLGIVEVNPFVSGLVSETVEVNGELVTVEAVPVVISNNVQLEAKVESKYLAYDVVDNTFSFSAYNNTEFTDWGSVLPYAVDADAYMVGAHFTGGIANRKKQTPYVTFHFNKTERGFDTDFNVLGESSCLVNINWDWSNHINSNKNSREFQAYKFRRHYIPSSSLDNFDNGYETVVSKNKVRGSGKALNVTVRTEPLKDCQIIGWEQEITVEQ